MSKINCDEYLLFNDPIPYTANNLDEAHRLLEYEIFSLKNIGSLSLEQQQTLKYFEEEFEKQLLIFYPILMKNCLMFYKCIDCLLIDKNSVPDAKVISMSYLDYLFYISQQSENGYIVIMKLRELLKNSLHLEDKDINFLVDEFNHIKIRIKNIEYDKDDFENFKEIICKQQGIELDDDDINPELKKALDEAIRFANKDNNHQGTLEDQIDCVMIAMHEVDRQKIKEMPIRIFQRIYQRYNYKLHYQIYKTAETGGMVTFKKPLDDWTSNFHRTFEEKYADVMLDLESVKKKVTMEN